MMADTAKTTRLKHSELEQDASSRWSLKHGGLCLACFHTWDENIKKVTVTFYLTISTFVPGNYELYLTILKLKNREI